MDVETSMLFTGCARIPGGVADSKAGVVDAHRRSGDGCACLEKRFESDCAYRLSLQKDFGCDCLQTTHNSDGKHTVVGHN